MARSTELERTLDRLIGIPVLALVGLMRRNRRLPPAPSRIGVIQPTAIGDMVLISGLLLHLHRCFPNAELHLFHGPSNEAALPFLPAETIPHCCNFKRPLATLREVRGAGLDILVDCAPWTRLTALLTTLSGAKATAGFNALGQYAHFGFDIQVPYLSNRHETENHRALAARFGSIEAYVPTLRRIERAPSFPLPYDRLILMHAAAGGSRAKQKSWPVDHWAALARRAVGEGWVVAFTGAPADRDAVARIVAAAGLPESRCLSLAGRLDLIELAYALVHARLLVTVDTGVAHLAAALDCRVVGLHGPTRFSRWGACNPRAIGLDAPHPASGYINYGFETHPDGDEIMASLTVDRVSEAMFSELAAEEALPALRGLSGDTG